MDTLISRNNTSFFKSVSETIKTIQKDQNDSLKYHQRIVHEYLLHYPQIRGILAYWEMGSGKTILAASLIDSVVKKKIDRKILFISSKTLHGNFLEDYKKYLILIKDPISDPVAMDNYIKQNCQFITLTANNMLQQVYDSMKNAKDYISESYEDYMMSKDNNLSMKKIKNEIKKLNVSGNLDNTFVVIDEAHNFFNGITNGSKNYLGLYKLIMDAKNIKILFLTGSPITNDPFEIALCFNMLNGYYRIEGRHGHYDNISLFGDDYDDFKKYFVSNPDTLDLNSEVGDKVKIPLINNKDKFSNRIVGLVSYYGTDQSDIKKLFPKIEELIVQKIPMSQKQYAMYATARDKEQDESKRGIFETSKKKLQKPQGANSSYRVRSRQISNFLYPKYASNTFKDENGFERYEKYIDKLKPECFKVVDIDNADANEDDYGLETWSPKMVQLLVNLSVHLPAGMLDYFKNLASVNKWIPTLIKQEKKLGVGPGIIYSQFIDSGIGLIGKILKQYGMIEITKITDINIKSAKGSFAIISGEVLPELRSEIVKILMSPDNKNGELVSLLLITATGAEGISTKYVRHIHTLEPFWHWSRIKQVFARASRLGSHLDLDEKEQTVQEYLYLSDYPSPVDNQQLKIKLIEDTTDVTLYYKAIQNQILIDSFLKIIKESSIDCMIHYNNEYIKCRMCSPTNEPLYIIDLDKDMKSESPCQELKEEKIKAQSIILEDDKGKREYMYYISDGIHILMYNGQLNAYQEIWEDHPDYSELYNKISKKIAS